MDWHSTQGWDGWKYHGFRGYKFLDTKISYDNGVKECKAETPFGRVLEVNSAQEHDLLRFMARYVKLSGHVLSAAYLGERPLGFEYRLLERGF